MTEQNGEHTFVSQTFSGPSDQTVLMAIEQTEKAINHADKAIELADSLGRHATRAFPLGLILGAVIAAVVCFALLQPPAAEAHGRIAPRIAYHHNWLRVASCESGQRWWYNGPSGFDGGLQFHPRTWSSLRPRYRYAYQAPAWYQIAMAEKLRKRSGIGQWPHCGRYW